VCASVQARFKTNQAIVFANLTIPRAQERTGGGRGGTMPQALKNWGVPKSKNNAASTFVNAVDLFQKDLRFDHRGAKLFSCAGAI